MYINKNFKITLISICIIVLLGYVCLRLLVERYKDEHCLITQISARIFDLNTVNVEVSNDLKIEDFKIINLYNHKVIFNKGKSHKGINNDYGEHHTFEIYYKDSLIYEIGYFKYNNWRTYDFKFLFGNFNNIIPTLIMNGSNPNIKNIYYKKFERDKNGVISKIIYYDENKKIYNEEITKVNK